MGEMRERMLRGELYIATDPESRTLASLNTRLSARGRAGISYDL